MSHLFKLYQPTKVSVRLMSKISNKRITRLSSDLQVTQEEIQQNANSQNDLSIKTKLVNRNPRNLEQLSLEPKKIGFEMDLPSRDYWNRLFFEKSGKHLTGKVVHHSGRVLVTASTDEIGLNNVLKRDKTSAAILAKILALRCLESGITCVNVELTEEEKKSDKVGVFLKSLNENGLVLKEPEFIWPRYSRDP